MATFNKMFGECTGAFGFPMREIEARKLDEQISKESDVELVHFRKECRQFECFIEKEHADVSIITDSSVDKTREVMDIESISFEVFKGNPQVAYAHNYKIPPIGRSLWQKYFKTFDGFKAKTKYYDRPENHRKEVEWFPDYIYELVKSGNLPGKSIGGVAKKREVTEEDLKKNPHWKEARVVRYDSKVYEYSVVGIPTNNNAEVELVAKGLVNMEDSILENAFPTLAEVVFDLRKSTEPVEIPFIKDVVTSAEYEEEFSVSLQRELEGLHKSVPELIDKALKRLLGKVA